MDIIGYGNFPQNASNLKAQSQLQSLGIQIRQSYNNGKNAEEPDLTVETLRDSYEKPPVDIFVILSGDCQIIPLLKSIRYKNKHSYVISARTESNPIVTPYADYYEYLENILRLTPPVVCEDPLETLLNIDPDTVSLLDTRRAKEVALYYYQSFIMKDASHGIQPISLKLYIGAVARLFNRHPDELFFWFQTGPLLKGCHHLPGPGVGVVFKGRGEDGEV